MFSYSHEDTHLIRLTLDIDDTEPGFHGYIDPDCTEFRGTCCDHCDTIAACYIEWVIDDEDEGYVPTDATLCADHTRDELLAILDNPRRSIGHTTQVTVNHWAIAYSAFPAPAWIENAA